ncbi:DNA pacase B subunit [Neorhizobium galegae bv. officinalis]|nr:DNA pacase B subunit [Neorhizobium galegae bv. officinalis]
MKITKEQEEELKKFLKRCQDDVGYFAETVFGPENALRAKQIEFAQAFQQNKRVTFKGGVGFGKTRGLAILVWWALFTHDDVQVTVYGPNEGQLERGLWKELALLHGKMDAAFADLWTITARKIERKNRPASCFATFALANKDNVSSARGVHMDNNFVFVDEATGVPDEVIEVLTNVLIDKNGKLCLISNPSSTSGYFYETWNGPISVLWTKVHGKMTDAPHVTADDLLAKEIEYGGKASRLYGIMVLGEFPDNDADGLIPRWLVEQAVENDEAVPSRDLPVIWGVDPAGAGDNSDNSVLIKRHDSVVFEQPKTWRGLDPTQLAMAIRDEYEREHPTKRPQFICVDANGLGSGVESNLRAMGLPVRRVMVSNSPTRRPEFYSRLRDQLWWEMGEWFRNDRPSIPKHADLIKELVTPTYTSDTGKIKIEKKDEIKKRLKGASPDYADALSLTFAISPTRYAAFSRRHDNGNEPDLRWLQ